MGWLFQNMVVEQIKERIPLSRISAAVHRNGLK